MTAEKGKRCIKTAILFFNLILFIAGVAVLSLGIFILVSDYGARELSLLLGNELYHDTAYLSIACGVAISIISVCGCCGSVKESKVILAVYLVLMSLIFLSLLSAAVLLFFFLGKVTQGTSTGMAEILIEKYGVDLDERAENRMITDMWNFMQKQLGCCGVAGNGNSTESWAIYRKTNWYQQQQNKTERLFVPESCCDPDGDEGVCTGLTLISGAPSKEPPFTSDHDHNPHLYHNGCYDELVRYIQGNSLAIGGVAIGALVILLTGILAGAFLCKNIKNRDYLT